MKVTPLQADFSVGEVAPDVIYRSTLEPRNRGVRLLRNFLTDSRGPVLRRRGFRFLGKVGEVALGPNVCDFPIKNNPVSAYQHNVDFQMSGRTSLDRDPNYLIIGGIDDTQCYVMENTGSWAIKQTITPPAGDWDGFGVSVSHSTSAGVLVVGAPNADNIVFSGGRAAVYTGSCATGWNFSQSISLPTDVGSPALRGRFGFSVAISENGKVIAIAKPNQDSIPSFHQAIHIYDEVSPGQYAYRNQIYKNVNPSDTGMGRGGLALSFDGKLLFDGDSSHGVGATGQVIVYDDIGGVFTERQVISAPTLIELGRDTEGYIDGVNATQFGHGVGVSDDNQSMIAHIPTFTTFATNTRTGLNVLYTLNPETNLYETCSSWYYDDNTTLNLGRIDMIFNENTKLLSMTKADSSGFRGGFSIHTWDFS